MSMFQHLSPVNCFKVYFYDQMLSVHSQASKFRIKQLITEISSLKQGIGAASEFVTAVCRRFLLLPTLCWANHYGPEGSILPRRNYSCTKL